MLSLNYIDFVAGFWLISFWLVISRDPIHIVSSSCSNSLVA